MNNTKPKVEKARIANSDFDLLLKPGTIGFYQGCEITQIFIFDKATKTAKNFFALFCFDELETNFDSKTEIINKERIILSDTYFAGILRKRVTISTAKQIFMDIQSNKLVVDEQCQISKDLSLIPKVFVANKTTRDFSFVNYVLKPNYWGDNYIIEFFDNEKEFFDENVDAEKLITKLKIDIMKYCPINLEKTYDRIGNLIFQFPITEVKFDIHSDETNSKIFYKLERHPKSENRRLQVNVKANFDDTITGFDKVEFFSDSLNHCFILGDDNNVNSEIIDLEKKIILHDNVFNFFHGINFNGRVGVQYAEPRTILARDQIHNCDIELLSDFGKEKKEISNPAEIIRARRLNNEIIKNSKDYFVYDREKSQDENISEAFNFVRSKLDSHLNIKEICLWDPYLSAADIIETLYWERTGIPFRCITCASNIKQKEKKTKFQKIYRILFNAKKEKSSSLFEKVVKEQQEYFLSHSNNLKVKLKFLGQHDNYGFKFHDRFLILVPIDSSIIPIVYSLGISVNQLGASHHMIQKVADPRLILHNFELLWNELDRKECLIQEFK